MGGKDSPLLQYSSSSPPPSPKWDSRTLGRVAGVNYHNVPLRCKSEANLQPATAQRQQQCEAPQWHSVPASPERGERASCSSTGSRSDGAVSPIRQYMECIEPQALSCAIVGDSGVGKSSLLLSYTTGSMPEYQAPTVYDKFSTSISVYGKRIAVTLCDTSGQDEFADLRPLCYSQLDAVIMCFSVVDSASYENIKTKWSKEVRRHCPGVPIVLVGTQIDKREDSVITKKLKSRGLRTVSRSDGVKLASLIRATTYVECSALRQLNVKNAFDEAIAAALELGNGSRKKSPQCVGGCTIL